MLRRLVRRPLTLLAAAAAALAAAPLRAQRPAAASSSATDSLPTTTRLSANTYLFAAPTGNVVVGAGGAVVVGVQAASLTPRLRAAIAKVSATPVRFVVATAGRGAPAEGAAGWGKTGALVVMHENLARAVRRAATGATVAADVVPGEGFSEVVQLFFPDEEVHVVHQPAGYSDADVSAHLEHANVLYLGSFTTDGYPAIDLDRGGTIDGLVATATAFLDFPATVRLVPGRGPVATTRELRAYRDMLAAVRDRIVPLVKAGRPLPAVLAARPTAAYDARWGHGPVSSTEFVTAVYRSLGGKP